jgi:hypothetical protein
VLRIAQNNLTKKYSDLTLDTVYSENNRRILEMDGSMMNGAMRARTKMILRGNRDCTVLIMYAPGNTLLYVCGLPESAECRSTDGGAGAGDE